MATSPTWITNKAVREHPVPLTAEQVAARRKGVLRTAVGSAAGVKHTPSLSFVADALPENARTIDDLLARAKASDEEVRKASSGADYAGGADPYRKPAEDEQDGDE